MVEADRQVSALGVAATAAFFNFHEFYVPRAFVSDPLSLADGGGNCGSVAAMGHGKLVASRDFPTRKVVSAKFVRFGVLSIVMTESLRRLLHVPLKYTASENGTVQRQSYAIKF